MAGLLLRYKHDGAELPELNRLSKKPIPNLCQRCVGISCGRFEIVRVLRRLDHVARFIVNVNQGIV